MSKEIEPQNQPKPSRIIRKALGNPALFRWARLLLDLFRLLHVLLGDLM
jgi:hypothetical protein